MLAAAAGARGQGFEWVKAYSGTDRIENMNQIKGSFVDAQGNTYIVGNMSAWGEILGVELLPREINRGAYNRQCVVIAKISPDGQLVWHKPIYSSGYDSYALALSRMGDTAFMRLYVHREGREEQSITRASEPNYRLTLYPNPTTGVVQVRCDGCTVKEATVISALGRREHVACRDGRIDLSHRAAQF